MQDIELDGLFADARANAPMPSGALLARIEADALAMQLARAAPARRPSPRWRRASGGLSSGGLRMAAGLVSATLVGIVIGLAQPPALSGITDQLSAGSDPAAEFDTVELIPAFEPFAAEG